MRTQTICLLITWVLLCPASDLLLAAQPEFGPHGWMQSGQRGNADLNRSQGRGNGRGRIFTLDKAAAQTALSHAPKEGGSQRLQKGVEWSVPMPDGEMKRFRIVESAVMAPELAVRFPQLKTYRGVGIDEPLDLLRLDLQHGRLHAQVLSPDGNAYIDPADADSLEYEAYYTDTALRSDDPTFECLTPDIEASATSAMTGSGGTQSDAMLRVYRLAVAATGEYTLFHGGTVESGLGAIVTAVNRLNGIYESELAIRFMLVANNDLLVHTDPVADPYSNADAFAMLAQNQSTLDAVIGASNYDVGHVFATAGGGLAQLDSACVDGWKGRGVTGRASPTGDSFYIDYFAHEIGHQFGARHTFNGVNGSCNENNRHPDTAYEPGSGTTIMSYSGVCGSDNVQYNSDPYFHSANLIQIQNFVLSGCATPVGTGNVAPSVTAGADYTIPAGTPFKLTASGSDADGDALTYCWEQADLGSAAALTGVDPGNGPLFRSFPASTAPTRYFPSLGTLLLNLSTPGEVLPVTARTLNFRVTARDNNTGAGAFGMDEMQLNVTTDAGPFVILSPNTAAQLSGEQSIVWDVAGTDVAPVAAALVDILLSTNGGLDYPIVLAEGTLNDGIESVSLPEIYASNARILVQASDNVFFDVSDENFPIVPPAGSSLVVVSETNSFSTNLSVLLPASGTRGDASEFPLPISVSGVPGVVENVTVQLHGLTHSFVDDLDILIVGPGGETVLLLSDSSGGAMANGVELSFSDSGVAFPGNGTLVSGVYQPSNVGAAGDSFPVAGPYGSALSVFNDVDPNGVWFLYLVDDSSGDSGTLSGGWSLALETIRVEAQTNQPPILVAPSIQYVHVGTTLVVTNEAVDPDGGGDLTFALRPDAPAGAVIDESGVVTWSPASSLVGSTNVCGVSVTDAGAPALTAESEFEVVVVGLPTITALQLTNGAANLAWTSIPGGVYRVECTADLNSGVWVDASEVVASPGFSAGATCPATSSGQRFFRIRVEL